MVELLASALTGSRLSKDVPPLKATGGEPHDLGQFYIVIDPGAYSADGFYSHLSELARAIGDQPERAYRARSNPPDRGRHRR